MLCQPPRHEFLDSVGVVVSCRRIITDHSGDLRTGTRGGVGCSSFRDDDTLGPRGVCGRYGSGVLDGTTGEAMII